MESLRMRDFTKDEQKKYTESITKLYKPTGGNIMADKRKSYEERMKEMAEEKARKEAKLEDGNLIKEVMNSDMNDDVKVEIIKRLAQKQEPIYIPYAQSPANWWESRPTCVSAPTAGEPCVNPGYTYIGDPAENQSHSVCESCNIPKTPISAVTNKVCGNCNGRGLVPIGGYGSGIKGVEKCKVCDGEGYVGGNE